MPVRRLPGGRGRVFARVDEIEAWLLTNTPLNPPPGQAPDVPAGPPTPRIWGAVAAVVILATIAAALVIDRDRGGPVAIEMDGDSLVTFDAEGDELWRVRFAEGLRSGAYVHPRFLPQLVDLDGDGRSEALFTVAATEKNVSYELACFSDAGEEIWRYRPTGRIATATEEFSDIQRIASVQVADLGDGNPSIILVTHHYMQYPSRIVVLTAGGETISEYWHSGFIGLRDGQLAIADIDEDGWSEIYAVGVSNPHEQATLVVLDPFTMSGASHEDTEEYQLLGFGPGREIARVFFPPSALSRSRDRYNSARDVTIEPGAILVSVAENLGGGGADILYQLNPDLSLRQLVVTDSFIGMHVRAEAEGRVSVTAAEEERDLRSRLQVLRPAHSPTTTASAGEDADG